MMLSENARSLLRKTFATFLFIVSIPEGRDRKDEAQDAPFVFEGKKIHVVIDFRNDLYSSDGLPGGFSYEMAKRFAEDQKLPVRISIARREENHIDSVLAGSTDILIRKQRDTVSHPEILVSINADRLTYWAVRHDRAFDMKEINLWLSIMRETKEYRELKSRFYSLYDPYKRLNRGHRSMRISPYDQLIKKQAKQLGWDWRLLAAVMYKESKFAINTFSHRGAQGLMQVMPRTGAYYGITDLLDPEQNIEAGCRHLARLQRMFPSEEFLPEERIKFTLAAYNAGEGRISDCRNFAAARGLDSTVWENIVTLIPEMRYESILSEDSVKLGRFMGHETIDYVAGIMSIYEAFKEISSM